MLRVQEQVAGRELTTFALGGNVALVVEPTDITALSELIRFLSDTGVPWRTLGNGSNVIIPDSGLEEVIIRLGRNFDGFVFVDESSQRNEKLFEMLSEPEELAGFKPTSSKSSVNVLVRGGTSLMGLSRKLSAIGLAGLEFAAGIPATVSGAVVMNAGAHGSEMANIVESAYFVGADGTVQFMDSAALNYSYRHSAVTKDMVVFAAQLRLTPGNKEEIQERRSSALEYRKRTQPLHLPSAGSVFRNPIAPDEHSGAESGRPEPLYAAKLLEQAGLKGLKEGGVMYSELHSNWLVKVEDSAKAQDVVSLIKRGKEQVLERLGVELTPEIIVW